MWERVRLVSTRVCTARVYQYKKPSRSPIRELCYYSRCLHSSETKRDWIQPPCHIRSLLLFCIVTGGRYDMQHRSQRYVLSGKRHQESHKHHWRAAVVQISSVRDTHTLRPTGRNGLRTLDQRLFVSSRGTHLFR